VDANEYTTPLHQRTFWYMKWKIIVNKININKKKQKKKKNYKKKCRNTLNCNESQGSEYELLSIRRKNGPP
jgi:hypothetical protein